MAVETAGARPVRRLLDLTHDLVFGYRNGQPIVVQKERGAPKVALMRAATIFARTYTVDGMQSLRHQARLDLVNLGRQDVVCRVMSAVETVNTGNYGVAKVPEYERL